MADSEEAKKPPTCTFFKKPSRNKNIRKRGAEEGNTSEEEGVSSVVQKPKSLKKTDNKLHFSSGSSKNSGHGNEEDAGASSTTFFYESSKEIQVQNDSRATATLETETEFSKDARAIRERVLKQAEASLRKKPNPTGEEKLYKGIHGYTDHKAGFRREHTIAGEKAGGAHGPLRASANIRSSVRFDYQPDICKDYKETGYCGYGDSCKFMHDRGDYKSGWQMEREWDEAEKKKKMKLAHGENDDEDDEDDDDEDSLPFACYICRHPFQDPVMTRCKHYFCEHCALKHHARNKKCFVCNKPTNGVFNTAHEILKKMREDKSGATDVK